MIAVLDLDGTLIDSSYRHHELMNQLLVGVSDEFDRAGYMAYKCDGHSGKGYLTKVLGLSDEVASQIQSEWVLRIETADYMKLDRLYSDSVAFLERLAIKGYRVVFLTARKDKEAVLAQLKQLEIYAAADKIMVVDPMNAKASKLEYCKGLMAQDDILVIGDTENEKYIMDNLGVRGYLLNRGFRSRAYWDAVNQESYASLLDIEL